MLKTQAYQHIRQKILQGELKPGDPVSARSIAKEVGMSFIPVREALARLAADGLVQHTSGLGCFVASPDRQDLTDMYQFRELLEGFAAEQAAKQKSPELLGEMKQANQVMRAVADELQASDEWSAPQVERWMNADRDFHRALIRAGGNRVVVEAEERLMTRGPMLAWTWRRRTTSASAQTLAEHDAIMAALERGDGVAARATVVEHIRRGRENAIKGFEANRLKSTMPST